MKNILNFKNFIQDERHFQLLFLASFLISLLWFNEFETHYLYQIAITIVSCIGFQLLFTHFTNKNYSSWKSALITSFSLSIILKMEHLELAVLASFIAIGSKFILKYNGKHIFNPANIGIIATILITKNAWISPGQWGSNIILLFVIGALGFLVIKKVKRIDIALAFILTYGGLLFLRNIYFLHWPIDFWQQQMTNGTLMLFTFFMITDPMTSPNHRIPRIVFSIIMAVIAFYLSTFKFFYSAPIWVLFFMSPLTMFFDHFFKERKFEWINN
jgi:Na+-transporting NADH:ubiquinone oxidoreductase subunit NqrB